MINFPNSPSQGQVFTSTTGLKYVYLDGVWRIVEAPQDIGKAQARNRIVNPAMQISQENGDTAGTTGNWFGADHFYTVRAGTVVPTTQRVQSVTPNGSRNRYRVTITTADAALASSDTLQIFHQIEGTRVADFRWGTASARQVILRFGWKSPAGTYSASLFNAGISNRNFIAMFTITAEQANTDTEQIIIIPGDTTGTWNIDTSAGIGLRFNMAIGTSYQGATVGWQPGFWLFATSAITNGMATVGNVFELFDVGLYLDPLNTGVAPPWQMPDEAEELRACQRYWQKTFWHVAAYAGAASAPVGTTVTFPTQMRIAPALADLGGGAATNASSVAQDNASIYGCRVYAPATAAGTVSISGRGLSINARM